MARKNKIFSQPKVDIAFDLINLFFILILLAIFLIPLLNVFSASFSSPNAVMGGKVTIWPVEFSTVSYELMFSLKEIWLGYANTFFYTIVGTFVNLLFTVLAAYPLSRRDLVGKGALMGILTLTMFFSGGLIPTFMVVRNLGMLNTRWAMIIPAAFSVYNMIIARTFFQTSIPKELFDAAEIDGANDFRTLISLVLPLSGPILAVLGLYYAVGHWNSYFDALIYLTDYRKFPLQLILRDYLLSASKLDDMLTKSGLIDGKAMADWMGKREVLKYAIIVVASLPMIILYPFIQRFFIQGVMLGSLKG